MTLTKQNKRHRRIPRLVIAADFDGVLFDADRFKRDYAKIFERHGVPRRIHRAAYRQIKHLHSGAYHDGAHRAAIQKKLPSICVRDIKRETDALLAQSARYLYRDAHPALLRWKEQGRVLALVSRGLAFQRRKVNASGLGRMFDAISIVATRHKITSLAKLAARFPLAPVVFIDDTKEIVDEVKKFFPDVFVVHMARGARQGRSIRADAVVNNLTAARRLIERYAKTRETRNGSHPVRRSA